MNNQLSRLYMYITWNTASNRRSPPETWKSPNDDGKFAQRFRTAGARVVGVVTVAIMALTTTTAIVTI
jgi:hypothetical protein